MPTCEGMGYEDCCDECCFTACNKANMFSFKQILATIATPMNDTPSTAPPWPGHSAAVPRDSPGGIASCDPSKTQHPPRKPGTRSQYTLNPSLNFTMQAPRQQNRLAGAPSSPDRSDLHGSGLKQITRAVSRICYMSTTLSSCPQLVQGS